MHAFHFQWKSSLKVYNFMKTRLHRRCFLGTLWNFSEQIFIEKSLDVSSQSISLPLPKMSEAPAGVDFFFIMQHTKALTILLKQQLLQVLPCVFCKHLSWSIFWNNFIFVSYFSITYLNAVTVWLWNQSLVWYMVVI